MHMVALGNAASSTDDPGTRIRKSTVHVRLMENSLAAHIRLEINGVPVEVKVKNDLGSPKTAVEIAKELRDQPDTLLIIGSVRTQETCLLYTSRCV